MQRIAMRRITLVFLLALLLAGCDLFGSAGEASAPETTGKAPTADLVGPTWKLVAFIEADDDQIPSETDPDILGVEPDDPFYSLFFLVTSDSTTPCLSPPYPPLYPQGNNCFKARGYPNFAGGTYTTEVQDTSITMSVRKVTEMNTLPDSREADFFSALQAATAYTIAGDRLTITYGEGRALHFEAQATDDAE